MSNNCDPFIRGRVLLAVEPRQVTLDGICPFCMTMMQLDDNYCPHCGAPMDAKDDDTCDGCCHQKLDSQDFPCNECRRLNQGEYDMYLPKGEN